MNTAKWLRFVLAAMFSILAMACTAALEQFAPMPTATATASPIPPTSTPAPTPTIGYEAVLADAWLAFDQGDYGEAQIIAEQVLDDDPGIGEAWALRGAAFSYIGFREAAIEDLEQALVLRYEEPWVLDFLSSHYLHRVFEVWDPDVIIESIEGARRNLLRLQELDPDHDSVTAYLPVLTEEPDYGEDLSDVDKEALDQFYLANDHLNQGEVEKAREAYRMAIEIDPDFALAYVFLGETYYALGDYESAFLEFERAASINPRLVIAWSFLGDALRNLGLYENAHRAYFEALMLDQENIISIAGLERIKDAVRTWDDVYFLPYGFRMVYEPDLVIEPLIESGFPEPSASKGAAKLDNAEGLVVVTWQEWNTAPFDFEEASEYARSLYANDPYVSLQGEPEAFDYSDAPSLIQLYTYDPGDAEDFRTGAVTVIACDARLFTIQFEYVDQPLETFVVKITPILESFRCQLE